MVQVQLILRRTRTSGDLVAVLSDESSSVSGLGVTVAVMSCSAATPTTPKICTCVSVPPVMQGHVAGEAGCRSGAAGTAIRVGVRDGVTRGQRQVQADVAHAADVFRRHGHEEIEFGTDGWRSRGARGDDDMQVGPDSAVGLPVAEVLPST
jgi:hypothetical protein